MKIPGIPSGTAETLAHAATPLLVKTLASIYMKPTVGGVAPLRYSRSIVGAVRPLDWQPAGGAPVGAPRFRSA